MKAVLDAKKGERMYKEGRKGESDDRGLRMGK